MNYLRDFFPHVTIHTSQLSKMLKKSAPSWGLSQTAAFNHLKKITQHPFQLKIPIEGQCILQINASDEYWGAVLLEKLDGKEAYCAHASGQLLHLLLKTVLLMMSIKNLTQNQCQQCHHQLMTTQQNYLQHLGSYLMTFPVTNGLLDFKNLLHGLISKEQSQMLNLKLSFVNSWPDLRVLCEIG